MSMQTRRGVMIWKVVARLCLTLNIKELESIVEHGRVITTLNMIKHENTLFSVVVGSPRSLVITKQTSL